MMIRITDLILGAWLLGVGLFPLGAGEAAGSAEAKRHSLVDVVKWVEAHWDDVEQERLEGAVLNGLSREFEGRIVFDGSKEGMGKDGPAEWDQSTKVFQEDVLYIHPALVGKDLAGQIKTAYEERSADRELKGFVLDLRHTGGHDYHSAAEVAGLFLNKKRLALKWHDNVVQAGTGKGKALIKEPVAVLVNKRTTGAAEALTAILRDGGAGVVIGSKTAGRAYIFKTIRLESGRELQIAQEPVKLDNGNRVSTIGIAPDIEVAVSEADERAYLKDPYQDLSPEDEGGGERISEADLVGENGPRAQETEQPKRPVIRDPALARAVDLLKGIALVRQLGSD